jgi:hypothetical protein
MKQEKSESEKRKSKNKQTEDRFKKKRRYKKQMSWVPSNTYTDAEKNIQNMFYPNGHGKQPIDNKIFVRTGFCRPVRPPPLVGSVNLFCIAMCCGEVFKNFALEHTTADTPIRGTVTLVRTPHSSRLVSCHVLKLIALLLLPCGAVLRSSVAARSRGTVSTSP